MRPRTRFLEVPRATFGVDDVGSVDKPVDVDRGNGDFAQDTLSANQDLVRSGFGGGSSVAGRSEMEVRDPCLEFNGSMTGLIDDRQQEATKLVDFVGDTFIAAAFGETGSQSATVRDWVYRSARYPPHRHSVQVLRPCAVQTNDTHVGERLPGRESSSSTCLWLVSKSCLQLDSSAQGSGPSCASRLDDINNGAVSLCKIRLCFR